MHAHDLTQTRHDAHAAQQAVAELRQAETSPEGEGACGAAEVGMARLRAAWRAMIGLTVAAITVVVTIVLVVVLIIQERRKDKN